MPWLVRRLKGMPVFLPLVALVATLWLAGPVSAEPSAVVAPPELQLAQALTLSSTSPYLGDNVTAAFKLKNVGSQSIAIQELTVTVRVTVGSGETVQDFQHLWGVRLQPGQGYSYEKSRSFPASGSGVARISVKINGNWVDIPGSVPIPFTVKNPLVVRSVLHMSYHTPYQGESILATFKLKNEGSAPVPIQDLGVTAKLGTGSPGGTVDFPHASWVMLQPGQEYLYERERSFAVAGDYLAEVTAKVAGYRMDWGTDSRDQFTVKPKPSNVVGIVPFPSRDFGPAGITVNPKTNRIYVTSVVGGKGGGSQEGAVINGYTNGVVGSLPYGGDTPLVAVSPVTNRIYVDCWWSPGMKVIDGNTNKVATTLPIDGGVPAVNPNTNRIYSVYYDDTTKSKRLLVMSGADHTPIATVPVSGYAVAVNPTTNRVYVAGGGQLFMIDGRTNSVLSTTSVPEAAEYPNLLANPTTNRVYLLVDGQELGEQPAVIAIDAGTNSPIATIPLDGRPAGIAMNPNTNHIFVSNTGNVPAGERSITVIDGATNKVVSVLRRDEMTWGIAVNTATNRVYVAGVDSRKVLVIQD